MSGLCELHTLVHMSECFAFSEELHYRTDWSILMLWKQARKLQVLLNQSISAAARPLVAFSCARNSSPAVTQEQDHHTGKEINLFFRSSCNKATGKSHSCTTVRLQTNKALGKQHEAMAGHTNHPQPIQQPASLTQRATRKPNQTKRRQHIRSTQLSPTWCYFGLVAHYADCPSVHPGKPHNDVSGVGWHDLKEFPFVNNL